MEEPRNGGGSALHRAEKAVTALSRFRAVGWLFAAGAGAVLSAAYPAEAAREASTVTVSWRYQSDESAGSLRLYRGADWSHLEPVLEVPVSSGHHDERFAVESPRAGFAVFQLRFRSSSGVEIVLGTLTWLPPRLTSEPMLPSLPTSIPALLPRLPVAALADPRAEGILLALPGRRIVAFREPLVPPPRFGGIWG